MKGSSSLSFLLAALLTVAYFWLVPVLVPIYEVNEIKVVQLKNRLTGNIQLIMIFLFLWTLFYYWLMGTSWGIDGKIKKVGLSLTKFISTKTEESKKGREAYRYTVLKSHFIQDGVVLFTVDEFKKDNVDLLLSLTKKRDLDKKIAEAIEREREEKDIWNDVKSYIDPVINDFDANGKIAALQKVKFVSEELEVWQEENMRWIDLALFLIPTIGFIGTVIGISSALESTPAMFDENQDVKEGITLISNKLAVAFDTTFAGLIFTALLFIVKTRINNFYYKSIYRPYEGFMLSWITQSTSKNKGGGEDVTFRMERS